MRRGFDLLRVVPRLGREPTAAVVAIVTAIGAFVLWMIAGRMPPPPWP